MGRGKKKNNRRQLGDDSDEDDGAAAAPSAKAAPAAEAAPSKQAARKQKRNAKQAGKKRQDDSDDDDDDDGDVSNLAALIGGKGHQFAADSDDDDDDDGADDMPALPTKPAAKGGRNKKKKGSQAALASAFESSEEEEEDKMEEDEEEAEDVDADDGEVEQVAVMLADDDWGTSKKKKDKKEKKPKKDKEKKEKKEKKYKKDKKKDHSEKGSDSDSVAEATEAVSKVAVEEPKAEERKKTKFELQMEAAMKKKEGDAQEEKKASDTKKPPGAKLEILEPEPDWVDTTKKAGAIEDGELEEFYGHGDEAWTDKSHALKEAEQSAPNEDDLLYGPDGKKLSNKERKKIMKAREAARREAEYQASAVIASREGQQFACSQTAVDERDPQWENSLDVNIPNFSISAAGKILFKDASLMIGHGRHYGLVGPNGKGKSTLLKMIASKDLKLPPRIDFLYVEQEVVADDTPAVEAVLRADKVRWNLLEEEKTLMAAIDAGDESEEKIIRLQEVVDELTNMGADAAESKARRILYGLGFSIEMQTKPTKMFSGGWRMRISVSGFGFITFLTGGWMAFSRCFFLVLNF